MNDDDFPRKDAKVHVSFPDEFLRKVPKTDLHVHLDGSLRISTLIELSRQQGLKLPYSTVEDLQKYVFKESYESLEEYLQCFQYTTAVMQDYPSMVRIAYEFAIDNYDEGVRYFEVRFCPHLHCDVADGKFDTVKVLEAVHEGLLRAKDEYNASPGVAQGREPQYDYGIIVSSMRMFTAGFSRYFKALVEVHKFEDESRLAGLASMALVTASLFAKEHRGVPVVALDIAGAECGYPAATHVEAYALAHRRFLGKTVHAGEGYGAQSIFQAITDLHAERIGHGTFLFDDTKVHGKADPKAYVEQLAQYIAERRITLEVCLTSNQQTMPHLRHSLADHPFRRMLAKKLSVSLCTDNRLVSRTTVVNEIRRAVEAFGLEPRQLREVIYDGFKRSFMPAPYSTKRAYNRKVMDYYEELEREYGITQPAAARHGAQAPTSFRTPRTPLTPPGRTISD